MMDDIDNDHYEYIAEGNDLVEKTFKEADIQVTIQDFFSPFIISVMNTDSRMNTFTGVQSMKLLDFIVT